jgi:hypothetical protein
MFAIPFIACFSLALVTAAHVFDQRHLLKDSALYANAHQVEKRQNEAACYNGSCSFLDSASACVTQDCICSALSAAGNETIQACETCIRPFDSLVADSLLGNAAQCAFLNFSTSATTPTTIVRPTTAPVFPTNCDGPCGDITRAFSTCTGTDYSCFCSPVFASGVACEQCLATVNGATNAELLISIDIPSCFRLANPQPITLTPNCFTGPCSPLIQATMFQPGATTQCAGGPCICPGALSAGSSCLQCLASLDPAQLSGIAEIVTSCQASFTATIASFPTLLSSGPTGAASAAASASPTNTFRSAAQERHVPGDIFFKGVIYLWCICLFWF